MNNPRTPILGSAACVIGLSVACMAHAATMNDMQNTAADQNQTNTAQLAENDPALDESVMSALHYCQEHYHACATATKHAAGVLVFPNVLKADLIVGGSGGKGALVEHGKIVGYYDIGAASAGLQAGFEDASQVYAFPSKKSVRKLQSGESHWRVGGDLGVTVMAADANARDVTGKSVAFIFDSRGLHGGVSADLFDIWKTGTTRPEATQG